MAIKSGAIIHDANGFVVDRIQTGGSNNLNIPEERIKELGNWRSVATIRDTPDLSFDLESFDVSTEFEALLNFVDPTTTVNGDLFNLDLAVPMDVISPFKTAQGQFTAPKGLIIPYLTLESSTYRFGVRANATQQHTLRGDSYFFVDGSPYYQEFAGDGVTATFNFDHTAQEYNHGGKTYFAVGACVVFDDGTFKRLFLDEHYTNSSSGITILDPATDAPANSIVRVVYGSSDVATYPQTVHQGVSVKPAAVRGKDIDVYVGTADATPTFTRWTSVQSFEVNRRVTLERDDEFGNPQYVSQDFDIPEVTGSVGVKPRDLSDLWDKVYQVANVDPGEIAGALSSVTLPLELRVHDPDTGVRLKTFYVPDARFKVPAIQGRVNQKAEVSFEFSSDGGSLDIYKGNRAGT